MQGELKAMLAPGVAKGAQPLSDYRPQNPRHFGFSVQAFIGETGDERSDSFDFVVCSPSWFAEHWGERWISVTTSSGNLIFGAGLLFMDEWSYPRLEEAVREVCDKATAHDWGDFASRVGRLLRWEFDYRYDDELDAARLRALGGRVDVRLARVQTKEQFIERVLAAVGTPEALRTGNWDAFEEQVRDAGRPVRLIGLNADMVELQAGRRILSENGLLAEDDDESEAVP